VLSPPAWEKSSFGESCINNLVLELLILRVDLMVMRGKSLEQAIANAMKHFDRLLDREQLDPEALDRLRSQIAIRLQHECLEDLAGTD
jgi:3-hydroxyacyl-CoA dehydrogenase